MITLAKIKSKPANQLQKLAYAKGITSFADFKKAVKPLGISTGSAWTMWTTSRALNAKVDRLQKVADLLGVSSIYDVFEDLKQK